MRRTHTFYIPPGEMRLVARDTRPHHRTACLISDPPLFEAKSGQKGADFNLYTKKKNLVHWCYGIIVRNPSKSQTLVVEVYHSNAWSMI